MGNSQDNNFQPQSLQFYTDVQDQNIGNVSIYTSKNLPMSFIMKLKRKIQDEISYSIFSKMQDKRNQNLITLYGFKKINHCDCEHMVGEGVISYWQYYNFYLKQLIQRRGQKNNLFLQQQIWYIIKVCCQAYEIFLQNNLYFDFDPTKIVISPEGKPKIFWAHLNHKNTHMKYVNYFVTKKFEQSYYSPQQIRQMSNNNRNLKLNFQKCNSFSFGMLLIYTLTLINPLKQFYNHQKIDIIYLKKTIINKVSKNYSQTIVNLLKECLAEDANERLTLSQIRQKYDENLSEQHAVLSLTSAGTSKTYSSKHSSNSIKNKISLKKK